MEPAQRPAIFDESRSKIVQQFWMRGTVALEAEIAWRLHNPPSEMLFPDPVDNHPGRQRGSFGDDCFGQIDPAAAGAQAARRRAGQYFDEPPRNDVGLARGVAALLKTD